MLESRFQSHLIARLEKTFPGCIIFKNDPTYRQGFPDITVLYGERWALLECKARPSASHRPNQDYYIRVLDRMSFARFVYPENEEDVIHDLQRAFQS